MVVMGLGITGRAVATALVRREVEVVALDDRVSAEMLAWADELDLMVQAPADIDLSSTLTGACLLYTSPSPRDATLSRMPSSA